MVQIIPAVLATDEVSFKEDTEKIQSSSLFKDGWVQIDLMDNKFVPNKSIGLDILAKFPISSKKEAQLLVERPSDWIEGLVKLGFLRIIFPIEVGDTEALIRQIKENDVQAGISINPETPVSEVIPFLDKIDLVLVMSVRPGFQGQEFIGEALDKVRELAKIRGGHHFLIGVDGGIRSDLAKALVEAGADNLNVGSKLLQGEIEENMEKFWEALKNE